MNLILFLLIVALVVFGAIRWCERKVKSGGLTCGMDLWDISRLEFDELLNKEKFSLLNSRVATPYLSHFYAGTADGIHTCIFSISTDRYSPIMLGVLLPALNLPLPGFVIKQKSFTDEVGDMLGMRKHQLAYPQNLIDKYSVTSEDGGKLAAILTPDLVTFLVDAGAISVECRRGALLVLPALKCAPENYEPAVKRAHAFAQLLRTRMANEDSDLNI